MFSLRQAFRHQSWMHQEQQTPWRV